MLLTTYKYAHFMVVPRHGALHVVLHDRADPRDMVQVSAFPDVDPAGLLWSWLYGRVDRYISHVRLLYAQRELC